jgi:hypothetical protein
MSTPPPVGSRATCGYCEEPIIVARIRTRREFFPPFWTDAWVHEQPMAGTDGTLCYTTHAFPLGGTVQRVSEPLNVPEFGRNL